MRKVVMKRVAVFGSGNGSNFEAIARYFVDKNVEFVCISDKSDSYILQRAKNLGIQALHVSFKNTVAFLTKNKFDLIVLAGYMRILPREAIELGTFVNIHPSLLPAFKGLDAIKQAYDYGVRITGVTTHFVNEEVDSGAVIEQKAVVIEDGMSLDELEAAIHRVEHEMYPTVIEKILFKRVLKKSNFLEKLAFSAPDLQKAKGNSGGEQPAILS